MCRPSLEQAPRSLDTVPMADLGLGDGSALLDVSDGGALLIDPERDPRPDLSASRKLGELAVYRGPGERAITAASVLTRAGDEDLDILGEAPEWLGLLVTGNEE